MKQIKIVYVITGVNVGGAERLLLDTVSHLDRARFEPVVVSLVGGVLIERFRSLGIKTYDLRMSNQWPFPGTWRLWRVMRRERPSIVHTHLIHADVLGRIIAKVCRVPVIVSTLHMVEDARRKFPYLHLNRVLSRLNTVFIAVSDAVGKEVARIERLPPEKIIVIRNAVADTGPLCKQGAALVRQRLRIGKDTFLMGIVSRLEIPRKGHQVFFEAMKRLAARYGRIHCAVIGDGSGKTRLEEQVRRLGLETRVSFVGTQHNVHEWLDALDLFILPSLHEGFPMAVIEAMARSRPIVATRVGGIDEMIEDEKEGMLVEPGSTGDLAACIESLICDPELRGGLGKAARARFEREFEINRAVHATQDVYERCLQERGISRRIRVAEVITNFEPGGVPRHVLDLIDGLCADDFDVEIVSGETVPERIPRTGLRHHFVPMLKPIDPLGDARALWRLFLLFRTIKPDLVHSHMSKANVLASVAARCAGVPRVINTIHGRTTLTRDPSVTQWVFDFCEFMTLRFFSDKTISVSHAATKHLLDSKKVRPAGVITIHNGIKAVPSCDTERIVARRRLNLNDTQPVILMTGRFAEPKRQETLIEACAYLRERYPDLVCLLAGDGSRRTILEACMAKYRCNGSVRMLGYRGDIQALLSAADIFVLCSWQEGLSIAVLEAMSAGLPVVASRIPGMDEVVIDGQTGYLVTEGDAQKCAEALDLLIVDCDRRRHMGLAGQKIFERHFSLAREVSRTQDTLKKVYQACT